MSERLPTSGTMGGESGSGKSTIALTLMGVHRTESGSITCDGRNVTGASGKILKVLRREVQMMLQDPCSSLDPRSTSPSRRRSSTSCWPCSRMLRWPT